MHHRAPHRRGAATAVAVLLVLTACTGGAGSDPESVPSSDGSAAPSPGPSTTSPSTTSPSPTTRPSPTRSPTPTEVDARVSRIPDRQWGRMMATGVWRPECPLRREQLRRIELNHHTFDGDVERGVLVVNRDVAASLVRMFGRLFDAGFPIRKMRPVEAYAGDVNESLRDDNTSAYNCRRLSQINAPVLESPHANGRAIDINPRENPWKDLRCDCWIPNRRNRVREPGPGVILKGRLVWRAFREEGWIWQNIDVPDYMHFDTGYPSRPYRGPQGARAGGR